MGRKPVSLAGVLLASVALLGCQSSPKYQGSGPGGFGATAPASGLSSPTGVAGRPGTTTPGVAGQGLPAGQPSAFPTSTGRPLNNQGTLSPGSSYSTGANATYGERSMPSSPNYGSGATSSSPGAIRSPSSAAPISTPSRPGTSYPVDSGTRYSTPSSTAPMESLPGLSTPSSSSTRSTQPAPLPPDSYPLTTPSGPDVTPPGR
jgi:hypothetical protein